jgi:PAS domain S-box-containing protein
MSEAGRSHIAAVETGAPRRAVLSTLAERLRDLTDPDDIAYTAAEVLGRALGVSRAGYGTIDLAAETIAIARDWNAPGIRSLAGTLRFRDFGSYIDDLKAGRTATVTDAVRDPRTAATADALIAISARSFVNMPVVEQGGFVALLFLNDADARDWSDEELLLTREVAERVRTTVERRRAETDLGASERRFRAAVAAMEGVLWTNDATGRMTGEQPGWSALTGQSEAEYQDYGWAAAVHPDDSQPTIDAWQRALVNASTFEFEHRVRRHDGQWRHFAIRAVPSKHADGSLLEWVGVHTDITELRAQQDALRRLNRELHQRVEQAIAEHRAALAQVHEMQKLETLGQLTGGVAHDFNNLLTPIVTALDMIHREPGIARDLLELVEDGQRAAEASRVLVSRLLSFARRQHLAPRSVDISALIRDMHGLISRSIGAHIDVRIDVPSDLPPVRVDPNQLELAILNLAVNARDAMPDGGVLEIEARRRDADDAPPELAARGNDFVRLRVRDQGDGMDAETLRRAVEPFYSTKEVGRGTGLGLSMVHGLAAQSGGALALESTPGLGTTATLWLPVCDGDGERATASGAAEPQMRPGGLKVLLVDDEALVRRSVGYMLRNLGHAVIEAASGEEALDVLARSPGIGLLLSDYQMGGMSGVALIRRVRDSHPGMPMLLMSGYSSVEAAGAGVARIDKPFRQAELASAIAALQ